MIRRLQPGARMSQAVIANGFAFLAGQVATDPSADVARTQATCRRADASLGCSRITSRHCASASAVIPRA